MEIQKITYDTKKYIRNDPNYPKTQTVTDEDMNEIKSVVNNNAYKQDEDYLKLKNALINVETEESKSIHIEDASELPAKLEILGNQEQEGEPTPNNPIEVKCLGSNKNLLNIFSIHSAGDIVTSNGVEFIVNEDGSVTANGTATALAQISFMPNVTFKAGTYTIKDASVWIESDDYTGWLNGLTIASTKTINSDFTITNTHVLIQSGQAVNNKTFYPKMEEGAEATSYSPYEQGSTGIKINNETEEISKVLNIQQEMLQGDYFVKEDDGWKEVHTWGKIIFNGTEGWYVQNSENSSIFQWTLPATYNLQQATKEGSAFCNHFKQIQNEQLLKTQDGMLIIYQVDTSYIRINNSNITNVEDFKSWLQQKNSEGKPVYIFYKTITPTKLACTEEQSAVLEELNNLDLFKGVNNIITAEDIALLKLNYIADTKTYVDNKYNQLANQILEIAGGN